MEIHRRPPKSSAPFVSYIGCFALQSRNVRNDLADDAVFDTAEDIFSFLESFSCRRIQRSLAAERWVGCLEPAEGFLPISEDLARVGGNGEDAVIGNWRGRRGMQQARRDSIRISALDPVKTGHRPHAPRTGIMAIEVVGLEQRSVPQTQRDRSLRSTNSGNDRQGFGSCLAGPRRRAGVPG